MRTTVGGGIALVILVKTPVDMLDSVEMLEGGDRATCQFTRLEESSLVPVGFLTAQFLQKTLFMK